MGMIGGGKNAFIGAVHRIAANMDGLIELVCGAFSSQAGNARESGRMLYLPEDRTYLSYEEMIEKAPNTPGIHFLLGRLFLSRPDADAKAAERAKQEFQKELEIDPKNAGAHYILGELASKDENWDEAIEQFSAAAKLDPNIAEAFLGWGFSLVTVKRYEEAIPPLRVAERLTPGNPSVHYSLATALIRNRKSLPAILDAHSGRDQVVFSHQAEQRHGESCFVRVAIVVRAAARNGKCMLFVEGDGTLVRLSHFKKNRFVAICATIRQRSIQKNGAEATTAPVGADCEIEKFHLPGGNNHAYGEETEKNLAVADHPASDVSDTKLEFAWCPLRRFRAGFREQKNF